ncbi:MAG: hypothetical protein ACI4T1_00845 [Christensenellales bacterium]
MSEIINFEDYRKKRNLSDEEIKSLFLGLVNLIKTSAIDDVSKKIKEDYKQTTIVLNKTLLELKLKNEIINELKQENENLKSKMENLVIKINTLKQKFEDNKF